MTVYTKLVKHGTVVEEQQQTLSDSNNLDFVKVNKSMMTIVVFL